MPPADAGLPQWLEEATGYTDKVFQDVADRVAAAVLEGVALDAGIRADAEDSFGNQQAVRALMFVVRGCREWAAKLREGR